MRVASGRVDLAAVAQEVLSRPSVASSVELGRYRARFDADRETQLLSPADARTLTECLTIPEVVKNWEQWRVMSGRSALQTLGLASHHMESIDYWVRFEFQRLQRTMKNWTIPIGCRVQRFKIVNAYVVSPITPTVNSDDQEEQYVNLSPHDARLSNSAYEAMIVVDIRQRTYCHPAGHAYMGGQSFQKATGPNRFQLPQGWESWPLESEEMHLRKPFYKFGAMGMSMIDKRATGILRPENFAYEDPHEQGGWFMCQNSAVFAPLHETLRHNNLFKFPGGGSSFVTANDACETPDEKQSFEVRLSKALAGAQIHMTKAHKLEIRCIHPTRRQRSTSTIVVRMGKYKRTDRFGGQNITVQMQFLSVSLPPTVLFVALGYTVDAAIAMMRQVAGSHWYGDAFDPILRKMKARHPSEVVTQQDACLYIADRAEKEACTMERKLLYAHSFLENEFFPQIGLSLAYSAEKALFLAYVLWQLLMKSVGFGFYDSIDAYYVQRYDSPGVLFSSLQRQISYKIHTATDRVLRSVLQSQLPFNWRTIFGEQKVSDQVACCLSKGSWSVNRYMTGSARTGATLALKTTNYFTYASSVRRSNTANKAHRRSINARQVAEDQIGRLCVVETPEGEMCGIARFQACGATISVASSSKVVMALLNEMMPPHLWQDATSKQPIPEGWDYWFDMDGGLWKRMGWEGAKYLVQLLRKLRRTGMICPHVSVHIDGKFVIVCTAPGRNVRLLIVLVKWLEWMKKKHMANDVELSESAGVKRWFLPLSEALHQGILEYVDPMEERSLSVAFSFDDFLRRSCNGERFSHMEVDPSWMLGVTAGALPHVDHNQAPRSVLGSAMSKQTFSGVINPFRLSMTAHILEYPQRPICQTRIFDDYQLKGQCTGQMVDFVIAATDHTMEDSWEFNQAAHDRGLHKTSLLRRYVTNNKPVAGTNKVERVERYKKPGPDCLGLQDANYDKICADGLPLPGTMMEPEDIIIGRTYRDTKSSGMPSRDDLSAEWMESEAFGNSSSNNQEHDDSISVRDERGVVQSVRSIISENGAYHIKEVILRTSCLNEIGDKYYCRHGQKGTTGLNRRDVDMLYSIVSGKPAMVHMNPIGILARMTHGHLLELHKSTAAAIVGQFVNATAFLSKAQKEREVNVVAALLSVGAQRLSYETHINGMTGELTRPLLRGVIFQSALAHLVGNKIHARNRGPRKGLTRQPDDGRSKHGGLRFGQMEVDCFAALGAAHFLVERLKTTSDEFIMPVCKKCGTIAEYSRETGYRFCRPCWSAKDVVTCSVSFSNKLFTQELMAMHVRAQLLLGEEEDGQSRAVVSDKPISSGRAADEAKAPTCRAQFLNMAKPEPWEYESLGIPEPPSLEREIQDITTSLQNTTLQEPSTPIVTSTPRTNQPTNNKRKNNRKPTLFQLPK
jgi:DNA-directed RNA polymerase II subunit RPB2